MLRGPLGLILYNHGALGSESDSVVPKGEVFYEAPVAEGYEWDTDDLAY